jgi:hypothetical protein
VSKEHNERFMVIMKEMINRQKTKGKKELLNLQRSANYGDSKISSRCRKSKTHVMPIICLGGFCGLFLEVLGFGCFVGCFLLGWW